MAESQKSYRRKKLYNDKCAKQKNIYNKWYENNEKHYDSKKNLYRMPLTEEVYDELLDIFKAILDHDNCGTHDFHYKEGSAERKKWKDIYLKDKENNKKWPSLLTKVSQDKPAKSCKTASLDKSFGTIKPENKIAAAKNYKEAMQLQKLIDVLKRLIFSINMVTENGKNDPDNLTKRVNDNILLKLFPECREDKFLSVFYTAKSPSYMWQTDNMRWHQASKRYGKKGNNKPFTSCGTYYAGYSGYSTCKYMMQAHEKATDKCLCRRAVDEKNVDDSCSSKTESDLYDFGYFANQK